MKFLLVEDDKALAGAIAQLLAEHYYVMDLATDGLMGRDMAEAFPYDLILLDWTLPKLEGVKLCQHLRNEGNHTPIILLTARNESTDRVAGLDAGADDYIVKPFEFEELLARIRALLRRAEGIVSPVLQWEDLRLDPRSSEVTCRGIPIAVTPKEYALLELFLRNPNRIFSLDNLLDKVWPFEDSPNVGSVRTHIKGLRQKLKKARLPDMITTVYGLGYRLKSADSVNHTEYETDLNLAIESVADSVADIDEEVEEAKDNAADNTVDYGSEDNSSEDSGIHRSQDSLDQKNTSLEKRVGELDLTSLWQSVSESYHHRVDNLANSLRALEPGLLDKNIQQHILAEAHALAGSLGSFGFGKVTVLCREMESILGTNAYLSGQHTHQLEILITQIQQILKRGLEKRPEGGSSTPAHNLSPNASPTPGINPTSLATSVTNNSLSPPPLSQLLIVKSTGNSPDEGWLQSLITLATSQQIHIRSADDIAQARQIIFPEEGKSLIRQPLDMVVLNFDGSAELPDNESEQFHLLADLQALQPPIPTIMLTSAASFENRVRVARLGVAGLLQTPVSPAEVLETATQVLQKSAPPAGKLLIVDDDPAMLTLLQAMLLPWGFRLQLLSDPQYFWKTLERFDPDLVLLDVEMPQISGFDICQVLRNAPRWHETPVLFMSGHTDAQTIQQVFSVGADDYIRKPIVAPELIARVLSWLERARTRQLRADVDSLTGVANRRKSTQLLTRLLGLAQRQGQTLCFALIDFDHFKQVNDEYGHPIGDAVLRRFGEGLRSTFRSEDVVGRWGGEEFVIGLYGMSRQEGTQRLRQFLQTWQKEVFSVCDSSFDAGTADFLEAPENQENRENLTFSMTFTAGVAVYPHNGKDLQGLYRAADEALYKAKAAGRNRVCSAT